VSSSVATLEIIILYCSPPPVSKENNTTFFYDTFLKKLITPPVFAYNISFFYNTLKKYCYPTVCCLYYCILPRYLHKKYLLYCMLPLSIGESTNAFFCSNSRNSRGKILLPSLWYLRNKLAPLFVISLSRCAVLASRTVTVILPSFFSWHHGRPVIFFHKAHIFIASNHHTGTTKNNNHGATISLLYYFNGSSTSVIL
jgi:hypothetical protein